MKQYYAVEDFIGGAYVGIDETKKDFIAKKLNLLHDFCMLKKNDEREQRVFDILNKCESERQMDILLYDVVRFNETIDEFITRKENVQ